MRERGGRGIVHIVQIVPVMGTGGGVMGVSWNLDQALRSRGVRTEAFTYATARRGRQERRWPRNPLLRAFALTRQMLWFFAVGTARAREYLAARPGAVSICHNNVMAGDIYVNHGVVVAAMRARGGAWWRIARNPTHLFTFARDFVRYRSRIHQAVVVLSEAEARILRRTYGKVAPRVVVIPNGVDLDRYHLPSPAERAHARSYFNLDDEARVVLFVGHELGRKGLEYAIDALVEATTVLLMVAGGRENTVAAAKKHAERVGVSSRVFFAGTRSDTPLLMHASDMFVLPSAYEANALVILEALASGLPVIATRTGFAAEIIVDDVNGYLVERDPHELAVRFEHLAAQDLATWRARSRASVEHLSWGWVAERYIDLAQQILSERPNQPRSRARSAG
jgi:glycosyltransferase involved in cell wall biosynthesis